MTAAARLEAASAGSRRLEAASAGPRRLEAASAGPRRLEAASAGPRPEESPARSCGDARPPAHTQEHPRVTHMCRFKHLNAHAVEGHQGLKWASLLSISFCIL